MANHHSANRLEWFNWHVWHKNLPLKKIFQLSIGLGFCLPKSQPPDRLKQTKSTSRTNEKNVNKRSDMFFFCHHYCCCIGTAFGRAMYFTDGGWTDSGHHHWLYRKSFRADSKGLRNQLHFRLWTNWASSGSSKKHMWKQCFVNIVAKHIVTNFLMWKFQNTSISSKMAPTTVNSPDNVPAVIVTL